MKFVSGLAFVALVVTGAAFAANDAADDGLDESNLQASLVDALQAAVRDRQPVGIRLSGTANGQLSDFEGIPLRVSTEDDVVILKSHIAGKMRPVWVRLSEISLIWMGDAKGQPE